MTFGVDSNRVRLFTKDDDPAEGGLDRAAPRDNVVFEARYFASARGHEKALIVREEEAA